MAEEYLTDDEQWEAVKRWLVENGPWVAAGIVLGAAALFGYRYVESSRNDRALRAAAQFDVMAAALESGDAGKSRQIAAGIIKDFPKSPYADQAQLTLARLAVDAGQLPVAIASLTQVMEDSKDAELKRVARLRLARVLTDEGKPDEAIKTLAIDDWGAFAGRAHEVRGDAFYAKKDLKDAVAEYKTALGGEVGGGESALLELKIADLGALPAPPTAMLPAGAGTVSSGDQSNKAKP